MYITNLDATIIVVETLFVVAVGMITAHRAERTAEGYFLASGKMPWWLIGAAFVSTSVSSEQIVGTVGTTYKGGLAVANWEWWSLPTYTLMLLFFIPLYLRNRIMTVPELLNRRYGPACGAIYSYVILLGYVLIFLPPGSLRRRTHLQSAHWMAFLGRDPGDRLADRQLYAPGRAGIGHVD